VIPFIGYLNKHRQHIVSYGYYQAEGISVGSGAIESTVKKSGGALKYRGRSGKKAMYHRC